MLQYILAFLTILAFGYFIVRKPTIETYLLFVLFTLPLMDTKILPLEYGFVKTFDVVTILSFLIFFKKFIAFKLKEEYWTQIILTFVLWVTIFLGKMNSEFQLANLYFIYQPFTIFIFTRFFIVYCNNNWAKRFRLINAFKAGFIAVLVFMLLQFAVGLEVSYYAVSGQNTFDAETGVVRYPGIFLESQLHGQFLAMGSFVFLMYIGKLSDRKKLLSYLGFAVAFLGILLAGGRSALGGFLLGGVFLFGYLNKKIKTYITFIGLLAGFSFFIFSSDIAIFSRAENISEDLSFRQSIWEETSKIIDQHPIQGIGFGNFKNYIMKYHQELYLQFEPGGEFFYFTQPENGYLKILAEQGYLGFSLVFILILIPMLKCSFKLLNRNIDKEVVFLLASLISWTVAFNTVYSLIDYRLLIMVGLLVCLLELYSRNKEVIKDNNLEVSSSNAQKQNIGDSIQT